MKRTLKIAAGALALSMATWSPEADAKMFMSPYNHPDFEWFTIETEHFRVHYAISDDDEHAFTAEWSARKAARVAEEMWQPMCEEFDYYLRERVDIVITNHTDYLEGFTVPAFDFIEVSANPGGYFYRMRGRMEWFSDVLVHEFAHVVSLKANTPLGEGTSSLSFGGLYSNGIMDADIGVSFSLMDSDPFWWSEGGAEFWSDEAGYNWWTAARDQNIRMTTLEDRLLTYEEWVTRIDKWGFDGERGYQQGYSFGLYLRERFGPETYAEFALRYGEGWRLDWTDVIEDVLGIDGEVLYDDWVAFLTERYEGLRDRVKAEGEVVGHELMPARPEWQYRDPDARDAWYSKRQRDREGAMEASGVFNFYPHYSDDGSMVASNNRGRLYLTEAPVESWYAFGGRYSPDSEVSQTSRDNSVALPMEFGHDWDFVPNSNSVVVSGREDMLPTFWEALTNVSFDQIDGYGWKELWVIDLDSYERDEDGREYSSLTPGTSWGVREWNRDAFRPIPNTRRGVEPAVSPDGSRVAYFEYTDGTMNLATIGLDGEDKQLLTTFADGTWMQRPDWSPDGSQIVFTMFRNFHNDLWVVNADGSDLRPLTWDRWEEFDAHWANDGLIYFTADVGEVFNVFSMDPETGEALQITNVVGGAEAPNLTPEGDLLYMYYTGHGQKNYGLSRSEFMNADATSHFETAPPAEEVEEFLAFQEDLSEYESVTTPYTPFGNLIAPSVTPALRYANDSLTNWGLQGGASIFMFDFVEDHLLYAEAMFGEDTDIVAQYLYQAWTPTIMLMARKVIGKSDYGMAVDADDDPTTTDDQTVIEAKNIYTADIGMVSVELPVMGALSANFGAIGVRYAFKGVDDSDYQPYIEQVSAFAAVKYSTISGRYYFSPNPRGGFAVDFNYTRGFTDLVYAPYGGVGVDDGMLLDAYSYNSYEMRYTHHIAVPDYINKLRGAPEGDPTVQVDMQVGWIDRNVLGWDEFRAGGRHPYYWGPGSIAPNTQFAGFPASSLSGETMAILNLAYRFPIATRMARQVGPVYLTGIYGQFFGTAGNLWSYRPPSEPGSYYTNAFDERIARDEEDVRRETPFQDYAYKNSPTDCAEDLTLGCRVLVDVGFELRVAAALFNNSYWNSFFRLAYGFNEVRGQFDVDGDDIGDTTSSPLGDSLSNETEPGGLRAYVGLGTSW